MMVKTTQSLLLMSLVCKRVPRHLPHIYSVPETAELTVLGCFQHNWQGRCGVFVIEGLANDAKSEDHRIHVRCLYLEEVRGTTSQSFGCSVCKQNGVCDLSTEHARPFFSSRRLHNQIQNKVQALCVVAFSSLFCRVDNMVYVTELSFMESNFYVGRHRQPWLCKWERNRKTNSQYEYIHLVCKKQLNTWTTNKAD